MIRYGFLFSLFTATTAMAYGPLTTLHPENIKQAKAALRAQPSYAEVADDISRCVPGSLASSSSTEYKVLDTLLARKLTRNPDEQRSNVQSNVKWRAGLRNILVESGLLTIDPDYFDEETASLLDNPSLVMQHLLRGGEAVHTLHIGGPVDSGDGQDGAGAADRSVSVSNEPDHAPDVLASPYDFRALNCLFQHPTQTEQFSLRRIVFHVNDRVKASDLLIGDPNFMDWISALLRTTEHGEAVLEIRGFSALPRGLASRMALHDFVGGFDAKTQIATFIKQPEPTDDLQDPVRLATDRFTPLRRPLADRRDSFTGSPVKRVTSESFQPDNPPSAAASALARQARFERLPGVPKGWFPDDYLKANLDILMHIIEDEGLSSPERNPEESYDAWQKRYYDWKGKLYTSAQEIFLNSFQPESPFTKWKGRSFGGHAPEDLDWIQYLTMYPHVFVELARDLAIEFTTSEGSPQNVSEARAGLANLTTLLTPDAQIKLAIGVHNRIMEDIKIFGSRRAARPFLPWKPDLPYNTDLHAVSENMIRSALFPDSCGDVYGRLMTKYGFTADSLKHHEVTLLLLGKLQDELRHYIVDHKDGIAVTHDAIPGWYAADMEATLFPKFRAQIEEQGLEGAFNFPIFANGEGTPPHLMRNNVPIWEEHAETDLTNLDTPPAREVFQFWMECFMYNSLHDPAEGPDFWSHWTRILHESPAEFGWKTLARHNDTSAFHTWRQSVKIGRVPAAGRLEFLSPPSSPTSGRASIKSSMDKALFSAWVQEHWWKLASRGTEFLPFSFVNGQSLVGYIRKHCNDTCAPQHRQVQQIGEGQLSHEDLVAAVYDITTSVTAMIQQESSSGEAAAGATDTGFDSPPHAAAGSRKRTNKDASPYTAASVSVAANAGGDLLETTDPRQPLLGTGQGTQQKYDGASPANHAPDQSGRGGCCTLL